MYKLSSILAISMLIMSCNDCLYYAKKFRARQFEMVVHKKYIRYQKQLNFEGLDSTGKEVSFEVVGLSELYDMVEIGDTMRKELGTSNVKLFRKDTCLVYRWNCGGRRVD